MLEFQMPQLFPILQPFFWFLNCSKKQKTGGQGVVSSVSPLGPRKVQILSQFGWKTVLFYFSNSKKRDTETSAQHPVSLACSAYSAEELKKAGISEGLVYISADLKDPKDIIADFRQAFAWV